jgi:RNA polymerase sigma-70 factor, ECF subfamily
VAALRLLRISATVIPGSIGRLRIRQECEELYTGQERVERLQRAICRLQPTLRNIVEIHQSEDRSVKEVAALAGISVAATKSRLLRARKILRKALG